MNNEVKEAQIQIDRVFSTSDFYQLLSASLHVPTTSFVTALLDNSYKEDVLNILSELSCGNQDIEEIKTLFIELESQKVDEQELLRKMQLEYTTLFCHPSNPKINIYETTFLGKPDSEDAILYISEKALHVEKCYKEAGLVVKAKEPADHIVTELEFMMDLYGKRGMALQDQNKEFLERNLKQIKRFEEVHIGKWAYKFFNQVEEEATLIIYKLIGKIGKAGLKQIL